MFLHLRNGFPPHIKTLSFIHLGRISTTAIGKDIRPLAGSCGVTPSSARHGSLTFSVAVSGKLPLGCLAGVRCSSSCGSHTDHVNRDRAPMSTSTLSSTEGECLSPSVQESVGTKNSQPVINFSQAEIIFNQKSLLELARSFLVLQMCSFNYFVDNSLKVINDYK